MVKIWSDLYGDVESAYGIGKRVTFENLQNVPFMLKLRADMPIKFLNLKSVFLPDNDDLELYDLDIANAEMRVLTAYSRDEAMIDAFNSGKDLHCLTASGISDYSYDDIMLYKDDKTTDQYKKRQVAKKVNFGRPIRIVPK